jgi:serpin B
MTCVFALVAASPLAAETRPRARERAEPVSPQAAGVSQANNDFAVGLYRQLAQKDGNLFCSPYSIHQAFSLVWGGARGDTAAQMARVLRLDQQASDAVHAGGAELRQRLNEGHRPFQLRVANALWLGNNYSFQEEFLRLGTRRYGAELRTLDLAGAPEPSRATINHWIEDQTAGRIKDLLSPGSINALTRLVLTNAIYFKGTWDSQFDARRTEDQPFFLAAGQQVRVPLMFRQGRYAYAQRGDVQVLALPYEGDALSLVVLLPTARDGLAALEAGLEEATLRRWLTSLRAQDVLVYLPRFKLASSLQLNAAMRALGMHDAFDPQRADFSGISGTPELYITDALHKAFVEVNEEGTEAAAATGIVLGEVSARPEPEPVFRADHPFLFLIRDDRSGAVLFLGRVANPRAAGE